MSDHELDAVTCALVGKLLLEGKSVTYGASEQAIVMPKGEKSSASGSARSLILEGESRAT